MLASQQLPRTLAGQYTHLVMKKEYAFSRSRRYRLSPRARIHRLQSTSAGRKGDAAGLYDEPLTQAQVRELRRRVADLDNPIRYLLVSRFGSRFALYYNVTDDVYVMNEPTGATLFKSRKIALVVKQVLGPRIQIIRCTTKRAKGVRVPVLSNRSRRVQKRRK